MVKNIRKFDGKIYELREKIYGKQTAQITAEEMRDEGTNARIVSSKENNNEVFYIYGRKRETNMKKVSTSNSKHPKIVIKNNIFGVEDIAKHDGDTFKVNGTTYKLKIKGSLAGELAIWHGDEYVLLANPNWENHPIAMTLVKKQYFEYDTIQADWGSDEEDACFEEIYEGKVHNYTHYKQIIKNFVTKSIEDTEFDLSDIKSGFGSMDDIIEVKGMSFEGMLDGDFVIWCSDNYALYATPNWEGHSIAFQLMNVVTNEDGFLTYEERDDDLGSFDGKVRNYKHYKQLVKDFLIKHI